MHERVITGILKQGLDQIDVREHHAAAAISMQSKLIQGFTSTTWGKSQEFPTRHPYSRSPCSSNKLPTCFRRPTTLVDSKALIPYLSTGKTANRDDHSSKRICNLLKARFMRKSAWFTRRVSRGFGCFGEDPILDLQLGPKPSFFRQFDFQHASRIFLGIMHCEGVVGLIWSGICVFGLMGLNKQ